MRFLPNKLLSGRHDIQQINSLKNDIQKSGTQNNSLNRETYQNIELTTDTELHWEPFCQVSFSLMSWRRSWGDESGKDK
jgi:hypothetical protein